MSVDQLIFLHFKHKYINRNRDTHTEK